MQSSCSVIYLNALTHMLSLYFGKDVRFKLFSNGTLRINNVEVYDGHLYSCESRTEAGKLNAQARVFVLGKENLLCAVGCFVVGFSMADAICLDVKAADIMPLYKSHSGLCFTEHFSPSVCCYDICFRASEVHTDAAGLPVPGAQ